MQIERHGYVFDAFLIERIHIISKDALANLHNPAKFEASLLAGILMRQGESLKRQNPFHGLVGKRVPLDGFLGALVALKMCCFGMPLARGDVILRGEEFGIITACASEGSACFAIVDVLRKTGIVAPHAFRCVPCDISQAWPADELEQAVCWYTDGPDLIVLTF